MSDVDFDPCAECESLKSGFVVMFNVPSMLLLGVLGVDETSVRIAGTLGWRENPE